VIGYQHSKHILGVHGFVSLTVTSKNANISTFISLLAKVIYFVSGLVEDTYSLKFTALLYNGSTGLYIEKRQN